MKQLTHHNTYFPKRKFPITLICDNINSGLNVGSLLRISDSFGIEKVIFCGNHTPMGRKMIKTSRSTEKYVSYQLSKNILEVIENYKNSHILIGLEITSSSLPLREFTFNTQKPLAIIVGNENFGISEQVLSHFDQTLHITMYGQNTSMNVVQATAIALYEITKQFSA